MASAARLLFWTAVAAVVLIQLEINPWWATVPPMLIVLALGALSFSTAILERAAGAVWLKNEEAARAQSLDETFSTLVDTDPEATEAPDA